MFRACGELLENIPSLVCNAQNACIWVANAVIGKYSVCAGYLERRDLATSEHVCDSYDRNVWVSREGTMQLCCDSRWAGAAWRESGDLRRFWEGAGQQRCVMASCNRLCGMSHSLRNTSSTLGAKLHGR